MIHREGKATILISLLVLFALNYGVSFSHIEWLQTITMAGSLIFMIIILQFFRNPTITATRHEDYVISPADGKVVVIEEVEETEYFKDRRIQVSVFMNP